MLLYVRKRMVFAGMMRLSFGRWGGYPALSGRTLVALASTLTGRRHREAWRVHSGEGNQIREAEARTTGPQAKECGQSAEAGSSKGQILP